MIVAISQETTIAVLGVALGVVLGYVLQVATSWLSSRRARHVAADLIYAELVGNLAEASAALATGVWTGIHKGARRSVWEAQSSHLPSLWRRRPHDLGKIATAYNRVDDVAYMADKGMIVPGDGLLDDYLPEVEAGLYDVGRIAGYSDADLEARGLSSGD